MRRLIYTSLLLVVISKVAGIDHEKNFVAVNVLEDGEVETRIFFRGIRAKETSVGKGYSGIKFRQLSDGRHFVQSIYDDNDTIKDCEFLHRKDQVEEFLKKFVEEIDELSTTRNLTLKYTDDLPERAKSWTDYTKVKRECKKKHNELKKKLSQFRRASSNNSSTVRMAQSWWSKSRKKRSFFIMPGTHWCGPQDDASSFRDLGRFHGTDKCCRRHDHCRITIPPLSTKYHLLNKSPFTMSHCRCDNRHKRDISDLLRVPGTKWCGKGFSADKYTRLGGFSRTDKCCRKHDTGCPFWIPGFQTKYGLFNWRINTIMHCSCDERFRACLKLTDTSDANLVGKIFFNVVQTQCFVLKPKKVCVRRSWWGKCEKVKYMKRAILRNNIPY